MIVWAIFGVLCVGAISWRPAAAVFCLILLAHFDLGSRGDSSVAFGVANTLKSLIIPVIFILRFRCFHLRGSVVKWWLALTVYAMVASLWSPFLVSAAKMTGYLVCYLILFCVIRVAWEREWLTPKSVFGLLLAAIGIGVLQTYVMGNSFGTLDEAQFNERFTSFSSPQSFAAFVVCCFSIIVFSDLPLVKYKALGSVLALYFLIQTGSRYCFVGCLVVIVIRAIVYFYQQRRTQKSIAYSLAALAVLCLTVSALASYFPNNRISELVSAQLTGGSTTEQLETVGSFYWRVEIYEEAFERLTQRVEQHEIRRLLFGSGTSSAGDILNAVHSEVFKVFDDNNRAMHNEFLRAAYEWGVVGLVLLCAFIFVLVRFTYAEARVSGNVAPLSVVPLFLVGLVIENLLAASSSPAGMGYVMAFSFFQPSWAQTEP